MLKIFLLFCLIISSLEIDHCSQTSSVCKSWIPGYSLVETQTGPECIEETKLSAAQRTLKNCYKLSWDNQCLECEKNYTLYNNK